MKNKQHSNIEEYMQGHKGEMCMWRSHVHKLYSRCMCVFVCMCMKVCELVSTPGRFFASNTFTKSNICKLSLSRVKASVCISMYLYMHAWASGNLCGYQS